MCGFFLLLSCVWILSGGKQYTATALKLSNSQPWRQEYRSWTRRWKTLSLTSAFFCCLNFLWPFSTHILNGNTQDALIKMKRNVDKQTYTERRTNIAREKRRRERENQFVGSMMENKETEEMEIYVWTLFYVMWWCCWCRCNANENRPIVKMWMDFSSALSRVLWAAGGCHYFFWASYSQLLYHIWHLVGIQHTKVAICIWHK